MAAGETYERMAEGLDRQSAVELWDRIVDRSAPPDWEPGRAFEYLIVRAFQLEGAEVRWPYDVQLEGERVEQIDGAVHLDGLSCLIETKDLQDGARLNVEPIAKMRNQLLRRPPATVGLIFSRSGFTGPAKTLARFTLSETILLWEREEFGVGLREARLLEGLRLKLRHAAEHAVPDYNPFRPPVDPQSSRV